ncbi:TlpA family protein disulfide reductase [Prolixibacteraceae bacterium JC049]|nr:TlpA family protein disulfide reductase [Prolixibacteraceae bacterium JC049]
MQDMKRWILIIAMGIVSTITYGQKQIPEIDIKDLNGKVHTVEGVRQEGKALVVCFFATWCKPCLQEMNAIAEVYEDWNEEDGFELIAISIDDSRSSAKVKSVVNGNDWPFKVFTDSNSELKRALKITSIPYTLILNKKGEVVYEKTSYTVGAEYELFEKFKKIDSQ